jgi:ABC-type phosphate transport system permease subunit
MNRDDPYVRRLEADFVAKLDRELRVSAIALRVTMSQTMRDVMRRLEDEQ